jgi:hypothetical protein
LASCILNTYPAQRPALLCSDQVPLAQPRRAGQAILGYTNSASLAFWDAYLKNDARAKQYLQSDTLEKSSYAAAKLSCR